MTSRIVYVVHTALSGMARARALTITSTLTLAAALFVMGAFGMALVNARTLARAWGQGGAISCGLRPDLPRERWAAVQRQAAAVPGVRTATLVPPEEALAAFAARSPEARALVEGVDAAALPAALRVQPEASLLESGAQAALAQAIGAIDGIEEVAYGQVQLQRVRAILRTLAMIALALGVLFVGAMVFMVAGTIRLMLYARQEEVRILRLVGATAWFVRAPFLLEGVLAGLMAGAIASLALRGLEHLGADVLQQARAALRVSVPLRLFAPQLLALLLACGASLGLVGSFVAVRRFLDEDIG
jgi:cell division transport system permease protein